MSQHITVHGTQISEVLEDFATRAHGLEIMCKDQITIQQKEDKKCLRLSLSHVEEILIRKDHDEKVFLQINLVDGKKLLLTHQWVGFKPMNSGMNLFDSMPNVVTTPDLVSVFEALEESKRLSLPKETKTLRNMYIAILEGGEAVGFDMSEERLWLQRLGISSPLSA